MKEIEITIDTDGTVEIDLKGFHGKGCSEITEKLLKALDGEVKTSTKKSEYYKPVPKTKVKQQNRS